MTAALERLAEALRSRGVDPSAFEASALTILEASEPVALPDQVARTIAASGGPTVDRLRQLEQEIADGALVTHRIETQLHTDDVLITGPQAAKLLGVDPSRLRHRIAKRDLVSFGSGRGRRLPTWQFQGSEIIPGVVRLAKAIPDGEHPLAVHMLMTRPHPNLRVGDEPVSPMDWLFGHGQVEPVERLLAELDQW